MDPNFPMNMCQISSMFIAREIKQKLRRIFFWTPCTIPYHNYFTPGMVSLWRLVTSSGFLMMLPWALLLVIHGYHPPYLILPLYITEHKLGIPLTVVQEFHSHLEPMALLTKEELHTHISFSYLIEGTKSNIVPITGPFPPSIDPTRYLPTQPSPHSDNILFQILLSPLQSPLSWALSWPTSALVEQISYQ